MDDRINFFSKNNLETPLISTDQMSKSPSKDLDPIRMRRNSQSLEKKDQIKVKNKNINNLNNSTNFESNLEYASETKSKTSKITKILNDRNKLAFNNNQSNKHHNEKLPNPKNIPQVKVMTPNNTNNPNYFVNENSLPVKLIRPSTEDYLLQNSVRKICFKMIYV
jgi:hypothetical protein